MIIEFKYLFCIENVEDSSQCNQVHVIRHKTYHNMIQTISSINFYDLVIFSMIVRKLIKI